MLPAAMQERCGVLCRRSQAWYGAGLLNLCPPGTRGFKSLRLRFFYAQQTYDVFFRTGQKYPRWFSVLFTEFSDGDIFIIRSSRPVFGLFSCVMHPAPRWSHVQYALPDSRSPHPPAYNPDSSRPAHRSRVRPEMPAET